MAKTVVEFNVAGIGKVLITFKGKAVLLGLKARPDLSVALFAVVDDSVGVSESRVFYAVSSSETLPANDLNYVDSVVNALGIATHFFEAA